MSFTTEDERDFVEAIQRDPEDDVARLIYADWLEEQGDVDRATYLRCEVDHRREIVADEQRVPPRPSLFQRLLRRPPHDDLEESREELASARARVSNSWAAQVARLPIENRSCDRASVKFAYECPLRWESLVPTDRTVVRECQTCHQRVIYCNSVDMARNAAGRGFCVAVDSSLVRSPGDVVEEEPMLMGLLDL